MKKVLLVCLSLGMLDCAWADISEQKALDCYKSTDSESSFKECINISETSIKDKWMTDVKVDPLTDEKIYTALIIADEGKSKYNSPIALLVRCKNNVTDMYINWDSYLGSSAYVTLRVGDSKAQAKSWSLSTDNSATFYPVSPINILKSIISSDKVVAQVTPYNSNPITAVFNTKGADEALKGIREGCKW